MTGGSGSFGSVFIRHLLEHTTARRIVVYSRDEHKQHELAQTLVKSADRLRFFIGDVRDYHRLKMAMQDVDIVIHAAALKQVPAAEYNPFEAVKTNILGAVNVIDAAIDCGVDRVIALSTDKAVSPINTYGATKLCAEKLFVQGNAYSGLDGTRLSCVRYGNVVASRGSVVPLFVDQRSTGVITITDERMTRFWITLDQGVDFVLRCLQMMQGGEIFVPKIPSMSIMDLATAIAPECKTKVTGVRPGEKIHELLVSPEESRSTLEFQDMFVVQPAHKWWNGDNLDVGKPLPDGFSYTSDNNTQQLSVEELREIIAKL